MRRFDLIFSVCVLFLLSFQTLLANSAEERAVTIKVREIALINKLQIDRLRVKVELTSLATENRWAEIVRTREAQFLECQVRHGEKSREDADALLAMLYEEYRDLFRRVKETVNLGRNSKLYHVKAIIQEEGVSSVSGYIVCYNDENGDLVVSDLIDDR